MITSFSELSKKNPELVLVLLCARTSLDEENRPLIKELLQKNLNWPGLVNMTVYSKVFPLVFKNLKLVGMDLVPKPFFNELQRDYSSNLIENLSLTKELKSILRLFANNGIPVLPYKGPLLALTVYGDLSLRNCGDLDILVRKPDVRRAKELLLGMGYQQQWPGMLLTESQEIAHIEAKYNYSFLHPTSRQIVELHWSVTPKYFSFPPDPEWLWQRLETTTLAGEVVQTFSAADYLLMLCVHGANHCWNRLAWICDISELINKNPTLDWKSLLRQANIFGVERILFVGLLVSHELLGADLPEDVIQQAFKDKQALQLADQIVTNYVEGDFTGSKAFDIPLFHLRSRERLKDKFRYCLYMTTPSAKDWSTFSAKSPISLLYYLLRPIRLVVEYGLIPLSKRFRHAKNA